MINQVKVLSIKQIQALSREQIQALSIEQLEALSNDQVRALSIEQIVAINYLKILSDEKCLILIETMDKMKRFIITANNVNMGIYRGKDEKEALNTFARESGYIDFVTTATQLDNYEEK